MKDLQLIGIPTTPVSLSPVLNDIEIVDYDLVTTEFTDRKTQDIAKILITTSGSVPAYPLYGSVLPLIIGNRRESDTVEQITDAVIEALAFLTAIEYSPNASERIKSIVSLQVTDGKDSREIIINLVVAMEDGSIATTQFPLAVNN